MYKLFLCPLMRSENWRLALLPRVACHSVTVTLTWCHLTVLWHLYEGVCACSHHHKPAHLCTPSFLHTSASFWFVEEKVKMNEEHSSAERPPTVPEGTIALAV